MSALMSVVALAGLVLVAYGFWLAYEPAGFIVGGVLLAAAGVSWVRGGRGEAT